MENVKKYSTLLTLLFSISSMLSQHTYSINPMQHTLNSNLKCIIAAINASNFPQTATLLLETKKASIAYNQKHIAPSTQTRCEPKKSVLNHALHMTL